MALSETVARLLAWLESTTLSVWVRDATWAYPLIETAHILGFTVLVGSAVMFDLRLLGLAPSLPVVPSARHLLKWSRLSLLVVLPSGLMLFMTQATETWANIAFRLKLLLLCVAALNALLFHLRTRKSMGGWDKQGMPVAAKVSAIVSLIVWTGVITCGRLIAYL